MRQPNAQEKETLKREVDTTTTTLTALFCEDTKRPVESGIAPKDFIPLSHSFGLTIDRVRAATLAGAEPETLDKMVAPIREEMTRISRSSIPGRIMLAPMKEGLDIAMEGVYKPAALMLA